MRHGIVGRTAELTAIGRLLDDATERPAALLIEGEPGIGKTALWEAGLLLARASGRRVLACRPAAAEVRLGYAGLGDLLAGVGDEQLAELPAPQRRALDAALLRGDHADPAPDRRAVAAAFLTVVERLAAAAPLVVAIDDLQWLDPSTAQVVEFATRRVTQPLAILVAQRTPERGARGPERGARGPGRGARGPDSGERASDSGARAPERDARAPKLHLRGERTFERLSVGPLEAPALHGLLRDRTGRAFSRPLLARIDRAAGGNPLFALEIAQALREAAAPADLPLPESLLAVVRTRIRGLGADVQDVLLAVSAASQPTVPLVQRALPELDAGELLGEAEDHGVVALDGVVVRFTHPLLASGVLASVSGARRRAIHRRLAQVVASIEERARHLALASLSAEPETVAALDAAAEDARARGAPAAAAELLELALRLGADAPRRRLRAAEHLFDAGDPARARTLLEAAVEELDPGQDRAAALSLLGTIRHRDDSYPEAAALLERALAEVAPDSSLRVDVALELSFVLANQARVEEALPHVLAAADVAERLGDPGLLAEALTVSVTTRFLLGQGLDEPTLQRALRLENPERRTFVPHRPSMLACLLFTTTGRVGEAWSALRSVREGCAVGGQESELVYTAIHAVSLHCWRGEVAAAQAVADDAHERALQLGTETLLAIALWAKAAVATWAGRAEEARPLAERSLESFTRSGSVMGTLMPLTTLGFLDLSLGAHAAAAERLAPLAQMTAAVAATDAVATPTPFAADAVEALVALGRGEEAQPIVDWLLDGGRALDRPLPLAVGGRCRALLLAADGELERAQATLDAALLQHDRIALPFERARTLLVLGRMQRRLRRRRAARATLAEALHDFEAVGTPLWAAQARAELERLGPRRTPSATLTPSEQRVAELAASGRTNRDVAAALFVSPKTVEATLVRVYRKLEIRSRAELGQRMARSPRGAE